MQRRETPTCRAHRSTDSSRWSSCAESVGGIARWQALERDAMFSPLSGVRVLDLSHLLAGPYCTYLMAMMGAEVIKIEPPEGDWTRTHGSDAELNAQRMGLTFLAQNAGKRSVTVNLKHPRGVAL